MRVVDWWVYENWKVRPARARVHQGKCPFCNNGKGFGKRHTRVSESGGRWHGPFPDSVEAMDFAHGLGRADTHICSRCIRYVKVRNF